MMKSVCLRVVQVCAVLITAVVAAHAGVETASFVKVLPFSGADNVRIESALRSDTPLVGVELTGRITPAQGGAPLWEGSLGTVDATGAASRTITKLKPRLWSPSSPSLYVLSVTASRAGRVLATESARFGFRSFENRGGQFFLNGAPVFLRGIAINPPGRGVPPAVGESRKFAEDYVRFLKSRNVNTIRLQNDSQIWFDVCDELGMMIYQGVYGAPPGSDKTAGERVAPPTDFERSVADYKTLFETYVRHPAIIIYVLSNEMPYQGARGAKFREFLTQAHERLRAWDDTRLYIGNAGYGEGFSGDVRDVHRYWGWYYNTFLTYYNLRDKNLFGDPNKLQPFTFTESVGNFTGPRGDYNIVARKQLAPQLNWTGHSANQIEDALAYQSFMVKEATESFRRLRPINKHLSGIVPFTILFYNWNGIESFAEMRPKPAMEQMGVSYQPVLLSWEMWTPQVYAGTRIRAIAHVINDADDRSDLEGTTLVYQVRDDKGRAVTSGRVELPRVAYYGSWRQPLELNLPPTLRTGEYEIYGEVVKNDRLISRNETPLFVAGGDWRHASRTERTVMLYDPSGVTARALERLGIKTRPADLARLDPKTTLVIGEDVWDAALSRIKEPLKSFVAAGGRILCLAQNGERFDPGWLPVPVEMFKDSANSPVYTPASRPHKDNMNINPERPDHPVFAGLDRRRLALWSDYTGWDQTKSGFPRLYPVTQGFKLANPESLVRTAILADYDRGLEGVALLEAFDGTGSVILSGFDLVSRAGLDPAADRLLRNLVVYAASADAHHAHPLIDLPIKWGDYATERGVITGTLNGFVVNADWIAPPTAPDAAPLTQAEGAWNTKPGDQFVPRGRRPAGLYGYTTAAGLRDLAPKSSTGSAVFWVRLPTNKKAVLTRVENPTPRSAELAVKVNDRTVTTVSVPPRAAITVRSPLPVGMTGVSISYTGDKTLLILETAFE